MTIQQIIHDLQDYLGNNGGNYREWYVGITSDPDQRLFVDHNVNKVDTWIHAPADSNDGAREVEEYFLNLGCDGGSGGGDKTSKVVYAYRKNAHTNP